MKDYGINRGLVQKFDTSKNFGISTFFGFRKMFADYFRKHNVPFYDDCCPAEAPADTAPVRFNSTAGVLEYHDGTGWVAVPSPEAP